MQPPKSVSHPTCAKIRIGAFRHNIDRVRTYVGPEVKIMAVVKSDAYGHGVRTIADAAVQGGAHSFGVARVDEGVELREEGTTHPILVFEISPEGQCERAMHHGLELTICSTEGAEKVSAIASKIASTVRVHIKVDTGMGRLGFEYLRAADSIEQVARLKNIEIAGVYSHFATAEDPDRRFAQEQLKKFNALLEELERRRIETGVRHMANSGAIINLPDSHFDLVRPGLMLYGYSPSKELSANAQLRPVMSLSSHVSFLKTVSKGASISYGRRFVAIKDTRIATVPIGYGDGYSRGLTNKAEVIIRGRRYPVAGTVCMDQCMVDVGNDDEVHAGDEVILLGESGGQQIDAWELAEKVGTVPYEVTCMISKRVQRFVVPLPQSLGQTP